MVVMLVFQYRVNDATIDIHHGALRTSNDHFIGRDWRTADAVGSDFDRCPN